MSLSTLPLLAALALCCGVARAQEVDSDPFSGADSGRIGDRDNTRLMGTVFDLEGNPLPDVMIWVTNDSAPANRVRSKSRKNGNYLVRGMASLYTVRDHQGLVARARFEREGFATVEAKIAVDKNGIQRVYPILAPEGRSVTIDGVCAVLVGTVTNREGKGIRGAVVELRDGESVVGTSEETRKDGEFEVLVWNSPAELDLVVEAPGKQPRTRRITLQRSPQPDLFLAQSFDVTIDD